ncbi:DUF2283 domain-containing protein [Corynebacterium gottingense]|uniref:DUF2283 domain-containing protein n=1 Tax=Corynebacterium gottingense TaxID=2041036 RepID=A0ABX9UKA6_9CORY|nr:DUF2283 domain-containing protein [Corynebacterium gottingense]RMD19853.1 DUF2283 domain-containing protein [Corynebacterium gottingense]WJZ13597.1 hypothetical protein CGOTT_08405 [Corynebacterium gottingense]WJZ15915.1 hypothetical protein CGOTTB_08370 [Corynebacterium gottingense]
MQIQVTRSPEMSAGYIELTDRPVSHSDELNADVIVDFDRFDCVVGVELLSLQRIPSIDDITLRFHVKTQERGFLELGLKHLMRMTATSGSLTNASQVHAEAVNGRELEAC